MKRKGLYLFAALFGLCSCAVDPLPDDQQSGSEFRDVTLMADAMSKSVMKDDAVVWEDGDKIALIFTHPEKGVHVAEFVAEIPEGQARVADFKGKLPVGVSASKGYDEKGYAVYPSSAVKADGKVSFALAAEQRAASDGSFASGLSLTSTSISLSSLDEEDYGVSFYNAASMLRFSLSDGVKSVTVEGTSALAGAAPLVFDQSGRLVPDHEGNWDGAVSAVTLFPENGAETFSENTIYNVLVWPGEHSSLTVKIVFTDIGEYVKTVSPVGGIIFEPSKFYTLKFGADKDLILKELVSGLDSAVGNLSDIEGKLDDIDNGIDQLLSQIQSISLMSEFSENAAYAPYAMFGTTAQKQDIELRYMVRPSSVAAALVEKYSDSMSALVKCRKASDEVEFLTLPLSGVELVGDIMRVKVNADGLGNGFYAGDLQADMAFQIKSGTTDVMSDFARLYPKRSLGVEFTRTEDVPVLRGAEVSIPFRYAPTADTYQITVSHSGAAGVRVQDNAGFNTGYLRVNIKDADPASQSVTLTLTSGDDVLTQRITFADGGPFDVSTGGKVDYIGGEVSLVVSPNNYGSYTLNVNGGSWIHETFSGVTGYYTLDENPGAERTATAVYSIKNAQPGVNGDLTYTKSVVITQAAYGTALTKNYYSNGHKLMLNNATAGYTPLNIVILGDGYKKKDLMQEGKFERSARSAMDAFFSVEPYKSFKNRFNVYAVAYESANEGPRLESVPSSSHSTYFESYYKGGGNTYVNCSDNGKSKMKNVVQSTLGLSGDSYYRTIVIVLINTSEAVGSTDYPSMGTSSSVGDGYASFAIAMLAANSTGTNGLIRHEAGGHAFGRLGDEYSVSWYTEALVNERHNVGFYRNVATNQSYWSAFTAAGYGSDEVMYDKYGPYTTYRSTRESGIMWNNNGQFNAVSRHAIYERIIKQSQGAGAYSWNSFLEWDKKNR